MYWARLSWVRASVRRTELSMLNPELRHDSKFRAKSSDSSCFSTSSHIARLRNNSVICLKAGERNRDKCALVGKSALQNQCVILQDSHLNWSPNDWCAVIIPVTRGLPAAAA